LTKDHVVVLVTTSSKEEAEKIANSLLNERLIACANIIGPMHSLFWWAGKIEGAVEYVLLMKSCESLFDKLSERVKALHSYDVPEIIALPVVRGYKPYVEWLDSCLK